jgi:hypothetical protein
MDERKSDNIADVIEKETSHMLSAVKAKLDVPDYMEIEPDRVFHPLLKPKRIIIRATIIHDSDKSK